MFHLWSAQHFSVGLYALRVCVLKLMLPAEQAHRSAEGSTVMADRLSPAMVTLKGCMPSEVSRENAQTRTLDIRSFTPSLYQFRGTSYRLSR